MCFRGFNVCGDVKKDLFASDKHFYKVFSLYYNEDKKGAVIYIREHFNAIPMMEAKKVLFDVVNNYEEKMIKGRMAYIAEQHPELII
ncbi:MAG: hypothetical protein DRH57_07600 [Candidatus Cloacimonadota bacterium]|nr:MAG: hypothetical protein DRH57_07600 [Candidatus Cloacimonadota bacterium]